MKYIVALLGTLCMDLCTKEVARRKLPLGKRIEIKKNCLFLQHIRNTGMAYHSCAGQKKLILSLTGGIMALYSMLFCKSMHQEKQNIGLCFALAVTLGGALGNFLERWKRGYVTDFLLILKGKNPPIFNLADVAILFGSIAMVFLHEK
ncbi:signal peptidase II [Chakrabartyella piscis]|uniref:signal peptidase II n=1 Tax=Chakrabartyella piscis TaxID=2918914 RepID=UPI002958A9E9|nr:signal peptidase II [Chakrabartyella piscis]